MKLLPLRCALLHVSAAAAFAPPRAPLAPPRAETVVRLGPDEGLGVAPVAVAFAAVLAAAGKLQADAMRGPDGLGAYLRDGDGYANSAYEPRRKGGRAEAGDPEGDG